jgi:hypothetical protein
MNSVKSVQGKKWGTPRRGESLEEENKTESSLSRKKTAYIDHNNVAETKIRAES